MKAGRARVPGILLAALLAALLSIGEAAADQGQSYGAAEGRRYRSGSWDVRLAGQLQLAHGAWRGVATLNFQQVEGTLAFLRGVDASGRRLFGKCTYRSPGPLFTAGFVCDAEAGGPVTRFYLVLKLEHHDQRYAGVYRQRIPDPPS